MRKREEIIKEFNEGVNSNWSETSRIVSGLEVNLEVLLDIRDILVDINKGRK